MPPRSYRALIAPWVLKNAMCRFNLLVLVYIIAHFPAGAAQGGEELVNSLKSFLNERDRGVVEVVYSSLQIYSDEQRIQMAKIAKESGQQFALLDTPMYYRVRQNSCGFLAQWATNIEDLYELKVEIPGAACGVISNKYWSLASGNLVFDEAKFKSDGMSKKETWEDFSLRYFRNTLVLGMGLTPGSFEWQGSNFTAEVSQTARADKRLRGQRVVTGWMEESNGIPWVIKYSFASTDCRAMLHYSNTASNWPSYLPSGVSLEEVDQKSGWATKLEYRFYGYATNVDNSCAYVAPDVVSGKIKGLSIVDLGPGTQRVRQLNGTPAKGVVQRVDQRGDGVNPWLQYRRRAILTAFVLLAVGGIYVIYKKRKQFGS